MFLTPTPQLLAALLRDKHGFDDEELANSCANPAGWSAHVTESERTALAARLHRGQVSRASRSRDVPTG